MAQQQNSSSNDFDLEGVFLCISKDWQKQVLSMFVHAFLHHKLSGGMTPADEF